MNICDYIIYDATSPSCLRWIKRKSSAARVGYVAGRLGVSGYWQVGFEGRLRPNHRIIWEMFNGPIPKGLFIDHINGVRSDNRIENLRLATQSQNLQNMKPLGGTSKYKGVRTHRRTKRLQAQIRIPNPSGSGLGKIVHLGSYDTHEGAALAYDYAAKFYFGEFAKLNFSNPIEELRK